MSRRETRPLPTRNGWIQRKTEHERANGDERRHPIAREGVLVEPAQLGNAGRRGGGRQWREPHARRLTGRELDDLVVHPLPAPGIAGARLADRVQPLHRRRRELEPGEVAMDERQGLAIVAHFLFGSILWCRPAEHERCRGETIGAEGHHRGAWLTASSLRP